MLTQNIASQDAFSDPCQQRYVANQLQAVADARGIGFSADLLRRTYGYQYQQFIKPQYPGVKEQCYVDCQLNLLFETMIDHYGKQQRSGRSVLRIVRAQTL